MTTRGPRAGDDSNLKEAVNLMNFVNLLGLLRFVLSSKAEKKEKLQIKRLNPPNKFTKFTKFTGLLRSESEKKRGVWGENRRKLNTIKIFITHNREPNEPWLTYMRARRVFDKGK